MAGAGQRATLLLRDAFGYTGPETAELLGTSPENVRVTLHRARARMGGAAPENVRASTRDDERRTAAMMRLMAAAASDDADALLACLTEDVRLRSDGGGEYAAALKPIVGRDHVARFLFGLSRKSEILALEVRTINGGPMLLVASRSPIPRAAPHTAVGVDVDEDGRVRELHVVVASRKLHGITFPLRAGSSTPNHRS